MSLDFWSDHLSTQILSVKQRDMVHQCTFDNEDEDGDDDDDGDDNDADDDDDLVVVGKPGR